MPFWFALRWPRSGAHFDPKDNLEKYCVLHPFVETRTEVWRELDGSEALGLCVESLWLVPPLLASA